MNTEHSFPKELCISLTRRCNARCIMCWRTVEKDREKLTQEIPLEIIKSWKDTLRQATMISWWGDGETFAYTEIADFLQFLLELPEPTHLFSTNGKRLSKFAPVLARINLGELVISIDGATARTLESIRVGVTLEEIIKGIQDIQFQREALHEPPVRFRFLFVSMTTNVHELPVLVKLAYYLKVAAITVTPLIPHHPSMNEWQCRNVPGLEREFFSAGEYLANQFNIEFTHTHPEVLGW